MENLELQKRESAIEGNYKKIKLDFPFNSDDKKKRIRTDINIQEGTCFTINNFLSENEVKYLVEMTEQNKYDSVSAEYKPDYRCCERILSFSEQLANILWKRLLPHFTKEDLEDQKPFGIGTEGIWIVTGINPCFRFCKYQKGGHFKKHRDGGFVINDDKRSVYTLMVYLNDNFKGGNTTFYDKEGDGYSIQPRLGTAVIFNHDIEHQGEPILEGIKYIFRTDIMFSRIKVINQQNFEYLQVFKEAERLYQLSIQYQKQGDIEKSTESYIKAESINFDYSNSLKKKPSLKKQDNEQNTRLTITKLPSNYLRMIFSFLVTGKQVQKQMIIEFIQLLRVCKNWYSLIKNDNYLWRDMYRSKWEYIELGDSILPPDCRWMVLYQQRWNVERYNSVFFIDIGYKLTYYGMMGQLAQVNPIGYHYYVKDDDDLPSQKNYYQLKPSCIISQIAQYQGHSHALRQGFRNYFVGNQITKEYEQYNDLFEYEYLGIIEKPWIKQNLKNKAFIIITCWLMNNTFKHRFYPEDHPILIALPFFVTVKQKNQLIQKSRYMIKLPHICFLEREYLALLSQNLENGTVILLDSYISTIVTIVDKVVQPMTGILLDQDIQINQTKLIVNKIQDQINLQKKNQIWKPEQTLLIVSNYQVIAENDIQKEIIPLIKDLYKDIIIKNQDCIIIGANLFCCFPDMKKSFQRIQQLKMLKIYYQKGYGYDNEDEDEKEFEEDEEIELNMNNQEEWQENENENQEEEENEGEEEEQNQSQEEGEQEYNEKEENDDDDENKFTQQ